MTAAELESYRQTLLEMRQRHQDDITHLTDEALRTGTGEASGNLSHTPLHMADLGTDNFEQEFTLSLLQTEEKLAGEIEAALTRLDQGTFGRCEDCQQVIPRVRLNAMPYSRCCVECARMREEGGTTP